MSDQHFNRNFGFTLECTVKIMGLVCLIDLAIHRIDHGLNLVLHVRSNGRGVEKGPSWKFLCTFFEFFGNNCGKTTGISDVLILIILALNCKNIFLL